MEKNIFQVSIGLNHLHPKICAIQTRMKKANENYHYSIITEQNELDTFFKTFFQQSTDSLFKDVYNAYQKLATFKQLNSNAVIASRTDLYRVAVLYLFGGVWCDMDSSIEVDIDSFVKGVDAHFGLQANGYHISPCIIFSRSKHPLLRAIMEEQVYQILIKNETDIIKATGPICFYNGIMSVHIKGYQRSEMFLQVPKFYENKTFVVKGYTYRFGSASEYWPSGIYREHSSKWILYGNGWNEHWHSGSTVQKLFCQLLYKK